MNSPPTHHLLVRDHQNLDSVARHLRRDDNVFFGAVCAPDLVPVVLDYLREKSEKDIPAPIHPTTHQEMLTILSALEVRPSSEVVSIRLAAADVDLWTALNWTREKLLRGARLFLFMDTLDDLAAFHTHAPDAYSFREDVFLVEGGPAGTKEATVEEGEPFDVRMGRLLYELKKRPEEKAEAAIRWAKALYERGRYQEMAQVVRDALALIPRDRFHDHSHRRARVRLYDFLMVAEDSFGRSIAYFNTSQYGLNDLGVDLAEEMPSHALKFKLASLESPLGIGRDVRQWVIEELPDEVIQRGVHRALSTSDMERGRFRAAYQHLDKLVQDSEHIWIRAHQYSRRARCHCRRGRFRLARQDLMQAEMLLFRGGMVSDRMRNGEMDILLDEGELDAVKRLVATNPHDSMLRARIAIKSGDISSALDEFDTALQEEINDQQDGNVFESCVLLHSLLRTVPSLSRTDLDRAYAMVNSAGQKLIDLAQHNPVWYDVLVPGLRAQMLSLYDDRHDDAITQAKQAVSLARSKWPQALARSLRIYVQCLARAERWNEMLPVLLEGMKAAREEDHLIELATLQAYDLARFFRTNASKTKIDTAKEVLEKTFGEMDVPEDLEKTFGEMDAPRVEGETWLEILPYLPLDGASFDVVPIAEHIHDLFTEMPMPEQASRVMEWLADAYAARGNATKADGAYRMALAPLVRHGFALRQGVIREKLARVE